MAGKNNYIPTALEKEAKRIMKEVSDVMGLRCSRADAYKIILSKSQMVKVPITPQVLKKFLLGDSTKWISVEIYNQ